MTPARRVPAEEPARPRRVIPERVIYGEDSGSRVDLGDYGALGTKLSQKPESSPLLTELIASR